MERKKKITNYTILMDNKLGEGAFGKVYVGEQDATKLKVAVKVLEKKTVDSDQYIKSALFSEIEILKCLKSPNIVGFLDVMESSNYYYIIQEYCNGGELRQSMKKRVKIPEAEAITFLTQICNGFVELIKEGVMHRDLKPENVLIHEGVLKIADFGFSKKGQQLKKVAAQTMVGTPLYMSPQVLKSKPYSSKCDIWSLTFIFFEMLTGRTPWTGNSEYELIKNIERTPLTFPVELTDITKDFIKRCLALDEKDRLSWDELLCHPIFKGHFSDKNKQFENKYKTIMNHIRYMIKSKNIDLESIFVSKGYGKSSPMNFQAFQSMMMGIDQQLTEQQVKYIFNKINESGTGSVSYDEFEKAISKFGIPMSIYKPSVPKEQKKQVQPPVVVPVVDPVVVKQQVNLKIANAFHKLIVKLTQQNKTLFQVFDAYNLTQKDTMNVAEYFRLMSILDTTFTEKEIQIAFSFFDKNGAKTVALKTFVDYFTSVTGQVPTKGYMRKDSNNSDTSLTFPIQNPNYNNQQYLNNNQGNIAYQQQMLQMQQMQQQMLFQQQQQQLQQQQVKQAGLIRHQSAGQQGYTNNNPGYGYSGDMYNQYRY